MLIKRLREILLRVLLVILVIFLVLSFILSLSPVQTKIAQYITEDVNIKYKTNISIAKVDLSVFGKVAFEDMCVLDRKLDTLLNIRNLRGNIDRLDLIGGKAKIDDIFIVNSKLGIKIYEEDTLSNLDVFIRKFKTKKDLTKKNIEYDFVSTGINIKDLNFDYNDFRKKKEQSFSLLNLDLVVNNIEVNPENVKFNVDELSFYSSNGFYLKKFNGDFLYNTTSISIKNLKLESDNSFIKSDLVINYPSFDHVLKKSADVNLDFIINESIVSLKDINYFTSISDSNENIKISMEAKGNIDRLRVSKFSLKTAKKSEIIAEMDLKNLLSKDKFDFDIEFYRLSSNYEELLKLLPNKIDKNLPKILSNLGNFNVIGKINFKNDFLNTDLDFVSDVGSLYSDVEVVVKDSIENANYKGNIEVKEFDLKTFLGNDKLGLTDLVLELDGKGFKLNNVESFVKGEVKRFQFNGYEYNDITINGNVSDKLFKGSLDINDENMSLSFDGLVDAQSIVPKYNFDVYIDRADLVKTNLFTRDSLAFLEGNVNINVEGAKLEDIVGVVNLNNMVYQNENDLYYFDEFNVESVKRNDKHKISISSSDIISGEIEGEFYFGEVFKMFKNVVGSVFKNYKRVKIKEGQNMKFNISFKNKIIDIFFPKIYFKSGTKVKGSIDSETNHLKLKFNSPGLRYDKVRVDSLTLWMDNKNTFFNTLLKVKKISTDKYPVHNLNLAVINKLDSVYVSTNFQGGDSLTENYQLRVYQTIDEKSNLVLGFLNSQIDFINNEFHINPDNSKNSKFVYNVKTKDFELDSIMVRGNKQKLLLFGKKIDNKQSYSAHIENVILKKLIPKKSKFKAEGIINADISVDIIGESVKPIANLSIDSLVLNSSYMGDLSVNMKNSNSNEIYNTGITLIRNGLKSLDAIGIVDLSKKEPSLDIDVDLDKLKLNFVNVFAQKIFNNIKGYASGKINVSGPLKDPNLNGYLDLNRAGIGVNYLGVKFNIDGKQRVTVKNHLITVPEVIIRDSEKGTNGVLSGTIKNHHNYKLWDLDLKVKANELLALNTTEDDNSLFYGTVYTSGEISIYGQTSSLNFDVSARTEKGTVFSIPLQNSKIAGKSAFIHFVPPSSIYSEEEIDEMEEFSIKKFEEDLFKGLKLKFNLEVTPDAQVEIVLDEQVGDVMKGRGNGIINMDINTKGDFSMNGTYVIDNGEYLFTMQNLINKKFKVNSGGTIKWNGNPLEAIIDLDAVYKTKTQVASYLDYVADESYNKLLVELVLKLQGPLMKPDISFDIKMPDAEASLQSQLEMKLNESEEERSRQFIMLITLNSFATSNQDIAFGGSVASSTAELIANQFSNIASGISDKFDVNVGYTTGAQDISNTRDNSDELEVGLSSQLFDDRITVNGNVGVPVGSSQSSIVGDVEVLINITKDGRYKGKVFTRQNVVTDLFDSNGYTQGVGISYQTNFDTFQEFIKNLFRKDAKKETILVPNIQLKQDTSTVRFK